MRQLPLLLFMISSFNNPIYAESKGVFIGLNIGYGEAKINYNNIPMLDYSNTIYFTSAREKAGGVDLGFIIGYKKISSNNIGFRIYGNLNYQPKFSNKFENAKLTLLNYGINSDFLYNFISDVNYDIGLFAGVGIGGNTYGGDSIKMLDNATNGSYNAIFSTTSFNMWLNAGLRSNFYKYFGLEVGVRVPFITTNILTLKYAGVLQNEAIAEMQIANTYNVFGRVTFSF